MYRYSLLLMLCLWSFALHAQVSIQGKVIDQKENYEMTGATVQLIRLPDSTRTGAATDEQGRFRLANVAAGAYVLQISFLGYTPDIRKLQVANQDINIGIIGLSEGGTTLKEVNIVSKLPLATQQGDTTQFNADAFKVNKDANAEDLITKMPGVQLQDGKVQAQGEEVQRVLVNGKPFFGNDPNAVLKNIPAEMIDKIQVFDQQSEQSQLTGFDDGNTTKTINIIVRPEFTNGVFGRVYGGYGTDERYKVGGNVNFFKGDRRISIIAQSNNVNEQNFASEDLVGVASGSGGAAQRGGGPRGGGRGGQRGGNWGGNNNTSNFLQGQQSGISTTHALGINYLDKWGKRTEVSASYFFNSNDNIAENVLLRQYILPDQAGQFYNENSLNSSRNTNHRFNMRLEWKPDSANAIVFTPRLSVQQNNGSNNLFGATTLNASLLNDTQSDFNSDLLGINFGGQLLWRRSFAKRGRSLVTTLNTGYNQSGGNSNLLSANNFYESNLPNLFLNQFSNFDQDGWTNSYSFAYTEPINKQSFVQLNYGGSYNPSQADRRTFNRPTVEAELATLDSTLSNVYQNGYFTQSAGATYRYVNPKIQAGVGASYQWAQLDNEQQFPFEGRILRDFQNILPNAFLRYNISREKNLRFNYRSNTNAPSISQLQNVLNNSNPLQLRIGNPDLVQSVQHNVFLRYSSVNVEKANTFFFLVGGSYVQDYIGNSTTIATRDTLLTDNIVLLNGGQITRPVNLGGYYTFRSFVSYGIPLAFIKTNLNVSAGFNFSRVPGLINEATNFANTPSANVGLTLSSNISEKIDFTIGSTTAISSVENTLQRQLNTQFMNQSSRIRLNLVLAGGIVFQTELNHQYFSGLSEGFNQNFLLWNASIGKKLFKQQGDLRLSVFDLLSQNNSIARNFTEVFIEDARTNILQQYFMLSFIYNIRKSGGAKG